MKPKLKKPQRRNNAQVVQEFLAVFEKEGDKTCSCGFCKLARNVRGKMKPEARVVRAVLAEFRKRGGKAVKTTPPGVEAGTPDILACLKGRMWCIECKAQEEEPSPLQKKRLDEWSKAGAVTMLVWDVEQLRALLRVMP